MFMFSLHACTILVVIHVHVQPTCMYNTSGNTVTVHIQACMLVVIHVQLMHNTCDTCYITST